MAEHHAQRRAALLAAVADLLVEAGVGAVTPAAVGARAGIARSSVYTYFNSAEAMIAAVVEDTLPRAGDELRAAMDAESGPAARIDAYLTTAIDLAARGAHGTASVLAHTNLPEPCRERLRELHAEQREPLRQAIIDLGVAEPDLASKILDGVLSAGMQAAQAGWPREQVADCVLRLVHHGLAGLAREPAAISF